MVRCAPAADKSQPERPAVLRSRSRRNNTGRSPNGCCAISTRSGSAAMTASSQSSSLETRPGERMHACDRGRRFSVRRRFQQLAGSDVCISQGERLVPGGLRQDRGIVGTRRRSASGRYSIVAPPNCSSAGQLRQDEGRRRSTKPPLVDQGPGSRISAQPRCVTGTSSRASRGIAIPALSGGPHRLRPCRSCHFADASLKKPSSSLIAARSWAS